MEANMSNNLRNLKRTHRRNVEQAEKVNAPETVECGTPWIARDTLPAFRSIKDHPGPGKGQTIKALKLGTTFTGLGFLAHWFWP